MFWNAGEMVVAMAKSLSGLSALKSRTKADNDDRLYWRIRQSVLHSVTKGVLT